MSAALKALVNILAGFGVAVLLASALTWWSRDSIAAWYQQLPLVIAKCQDIK